MKKVLVISNNYPNEKNRYGGAFIHARVKEYSKTYDISVIGINTKLPNEFNYEEVNVKFFRDKNSFIDYIKEYKPDVLLVHFLKYWMVDIITKKFKIPTIIWVHGFEIYGWYRRLFEFSISYGFFRNIIGSIVQIFYWRKIIRYSNSNNLVHFVFVSEWLKKISEQDCFSKFKHFSIIPNPIDVEAFSYTEKPVEQRKKILMIRSFSARKYANDIAVNGIIELSKHPSFQEFEFQIFGDGRLFDPLTSKLRDFKNVKINKTFIENRLIPEIQKDFGVFLCPTRQDTHGVSMCEAMSSGLVPVTCNNTAIPEFVQDHQSGLFADNPKEIAKAILELREQPDLFSRISENAASSIREKCGKDQMIKKEIEIIDRYLSSNTQIQK